MKAMAYSLTIDGRQVSDFTDLKIFMAIKNICVMNKLADKENFDGSRHHYCDGVELTRALEPEWPSYAHYYLRKIDNHLNFLAMKRLITKHKRNSAPYGYGDDEQFCLTPEAEKLIVDSENNNQLKIRILEIFDPLEDGEMLESRWPYAKRRITND